MAGQGRSWEPCPAVLADGLTPCGNKRRPGAEFCDRHLAEAEAAAAGESPGGVGLDEAADVGSLAPVPEEEGATSRVATSQVRAQLADDLADSYGLVQDALRSAMDAGKPFRTRCSKCHEAIQVVVPDHATRLKAVDSWFELGFGRPATAPARETELSLAAVSTLEDLERLSNNELAAFVWLGSSPEQRGRDRELAERCAERLPSGFAEALDLLASIDLLCSLAAPESAVRA